MGSGAQDCPKLVNGPGLLPLRLIVRLPRYHMQYCMVAALKLHKRQSELDRQSADSHNQSVTQKSWQRRSIISFALGKCHFIQTSRIEESSQYYGISSKFGQISVEKEKRRRLHGFHR